MFWRLSNLRVKTLVFIIFINFQYKILMCDDSFKFSVINDDCIDF